MVSHVSHVSSDVSYSNLSKLCFAHYQTKLFSCTYDFSSSLDNGLSAPTLTLEHFREGRGDDATPEYEVNGCDAAHARALINVRSFFTNHVANRCETSRG